MPPKLVGCGCFPGDVTSTTFCLRPCSYPFTFHYRKHQLKLKSHWRESQVNLGAYSCEFISAQFLTRHCQCICRPSKRLVRSQSFQTPIIICSFGSDNCAFFVLEHSYRGQCLDSKPHAVEEVYNTDIHKTSMVSLPESHLTTEYCKIRYIFMSAQLDLSFHHVSV